MTWQPDLASEIVTALGGQPAHGSAVSPGRGRASNLHEPAKERDAQGGPSASDTLIRHGPRVEEMGAGPHGHICVGGATIVCGTGW